MTVIDHAALEDVGDCVNVPKQIQIVWPKEKILWEIKPLVAEFQKKRVQCIAMGSF